MTKEQEKILDKPYKGARQNAIRKYIPLVIKEALDWNAASLSFLSREIKDWAKELGRELSPREQQALVLAQTKLKQRDVSKTMDSIRRLAQI
ncbi:MAG: hypothetical protein NZO16_00075 [Deltaproteobacteria bacterium]|nr:hypothetical protein [Deltaproteobacteria bacterium]